MIYKKVMPMALTKMITLTLLPNTGVHLIIGRGGGMFPLLLSTTHPRDDEQWGAGVGGGAIMLQTSIFRI